MDQKILKYLDQYCSKSTFCVTQMQAMKESLKDEMDNFS